MLKEGKEMVRDKVALDWQTSVCLRYKDDMRAVHCGGDNRRKYRM